MRSTNLATAGLLLLGAVLLAHPNLGRAEAQPLSGSASDSAGSPQPDKNLPDDLVDSKPIFDYFADQRMPDTVEDLLQELKRPDRCGQAARLQPNEACAIVFYKLDSEFSPGPLRPPLIMRAIYRITEPKNLAHPIMTMPDRTGALQRYTDGDLFEPLRNIRANICQLDKRMPDQCRATNSKGVLYLPYGILGKLENDRETILPVRSANKHFALNLKSADADWLKEQQMLDLCAQRFWDRPVLIC